MVGIEEVWKNILTEKKWVQYRIGTGGFKVQGSRFKVTND